MKLSLSIISEGDHSKLKRAVKSVYKYVDHIFITTTKKKEPQWRDPKISWSYFPWNDDFSAVRNFNLEQIPKDFTHLLWIDSDDVVEHAETIRDVVEVMEEKGLDAVFTDYHYSIDKKGNVLINHPRERIIRLGVYHWKGKLHETLIPNRKVRTVFIKDFVIKHYPTDENKKDGLNRNLRVLSKDYEEQRKKLVAGEIEEIDPRTEYYLARCLYDTKTDVGLKRAFQLFQNYIEHSGWGEEKAFAWNYLGNISYNFQKYEDSLTCYLSAIKEAPEFPTWHINLARSYAALKDFQKAKHHIQVGINMKEPQTAMILTPSEDRISALIVLFYVWFDEKDFKQALTAASMLYDLQPTKENARRIESVEKLQKWTKWSQNVTQMVQEMDEDGEIDKIDRMLASLPKDIENTVYTTHLKNQYAKPFVWPQNSIAYYAAIDTLEWSPKAVKEGLGGSESAVMYLAKEWTRLGYKVTVYTNVGANEGMHDGVEYLNFQRFNFKDKFDIVVSWRNPHFIHKNIIDCRLMLLDLHDVPEIGEYDEELLAKTDYIMVKSPYHRSLLPGVPDEKFKVINNGIDWDWIKKFKLKKKKNWIFYGSSYDRGLEGLLEIWPEIRKEVPNAMLHVCYGWDLFLRLRSHVRSQMKWKSMMDKLLNQPGIVHHGKLGHKELYKLAAQCSVWAYPTTFEEIDCITARYCQALGTIPVVYNYAALETTVQRGVRLSVDPKDRKSIKVYKDELIKALKDGKTIKDRKKIGKSFDWSNRAKEWVEVFGEQPKQDVKLTVFTPTIRTGFWNLMAKNLSNQTYKNFEWLIVDDYKEDRSKIADKYAKKYNLDIRYMRGKLDRSKYNYALIQADNMAIFNATGSLIVWLQDFILLPKQGLERMVNVHKRNPKALIAPVDKYYKMSIKPNFKNKEDWFDGKTDVIGDLIRQNIRIRRGELRLTKNPFDFEMNIGAIPTKVARSLNGLWEFQDDGLGFNNTDIAFRAIRAGYPVLVDERLRAVCLDLWEHLRGKKENAPDREWNLNDARFKFLYEATKHGVLPLVRDANIDRKLKFDNKMPKNLDPEGAAKWIQKNTKKIAKRFMEEYAKNRN